MKTKMPVVKLDFNELDDKEKIKYADMFCEGSKELKSLLIFLWNNKINTYGCCIGHGSNKNDVPYISFDVDKIAKEDLSNIIKTCYYEFFGRVLISGVLAKKGENLKRMIVFSYQSFDLPQNNQFFKNLQAIISKCINSNIANFNNLHKTPKTEFYINDLTSILYISKQKFFEDDKFKDIKEIQINDKRFIIKTSIISPSHLINVKNKIWANGERNTKLKWDYISKSTFYKIKHNKYLVANKNFDNLTMVDKKYITDNNLKNAKTEFKKSHTKYNHKNFKKIFKNL